MDNVIVPSGEARTLEGTQVTGGVLAEVRSSLVVRGADVGGHIRCDRCRYAEVFDRTVGGSLELTGLREGAFIENNPNTGDVVTTDSTDEEAPIGCCFRLAANEIGAVSSGQNNRSHADFNDNVIPGDIVAFKNDGVGLFNNMVGRAGWLPLHSRFPWMWLSKLGR